MFDQRFGKLPVKIVFTGVTPGSPLAQELYAARAGAVKQFVNNSRQRQQHQDLAQFATHTRMPNGDKLSYTHNNGMETVIVALSVQAPTREQPVVEIPDPEAIEAVYLMIDVLAATYEYLESEIVLWVPGPGGGGGDGGGEGEDDGRIYTRTIRWEIDNAFRLLVAEVGDFGELLEPGDENIRSVPYDELGNTLPSGKPLGEITGPTRVHPYETVVDEFVVRGAMVEKPADEDINIQVRLYGHSLSGRRVLAFPGAEDVPDRDESGDEWTAVSEPRDIKIHVRAVKGKIVKVIIPTEIPAAEATDVASNADPQIPLKPAAPTETIDDTIVFPASPDWTSQGPSFPPAYPFAEGMGDLLAEAGPDERTLAEQLERDTNLTRAQSTYLGQVSWTAEVGTDLGDVDLTVP